MIVIADSGSSKTAWRIVSGDGKVSQETTPGLNPWFLGPDEMQSEIESSFLKDLTGIDALYFYGSGCHSDEMKARMQDHFRSLVQSGTIEIHDDLLGAARATCGRESGLVGILGTGSNSCYYDGNGIAEQVDSLGYILGDEGSGSYMGKRLIADFLREEMPEAIREKLLRRPGMDRDTILRKVYREERPNRFLAGFGTFLHQNRKDPYVAELLFDSINDFFHAHLLKYPGSDGLTCHFVGSIAFYFNDIIRKAAGENGIRVGKILENPVAGLTLYHTPQL